MSMDFAGGLLVGVIVGLGMAVVLLLPDIRETNKAVLLMLDKLAPEYIDKWEAIKLGRSIKRQTTDECASSSPVTPDH